MHNQREMPTWDDKSNDFERQRSEHINEEPFREIVLCDISWVHVDLSSVVLKWSHEVYEHVCEEESVNDVVQITQDICLAHIDLHSDLDRHCDDVV